MATSKNATKSSIPTSLRIDQINARTRDLDALISAYRIIATDYFNNGHQKDHEKAVEMLASYYDERRRLQAELASI